MDAAKLPSHHLAILALISDASVDIPIRQAAAVRFKNVVAKGWDANCPDGTDGIVFTDPDRINIKNNLVDFMCSTPHQIQTLLSATIGIIANVDYPERWESLLPKLVEKLQSQDPVILIGILKTADSIFNRFVGADRNDNLYRVIKYSLDGSQQPLLALYQHLGTRVAASASNGEQLKANLECLRLVTDILYSLNYQDLPEFFEDNMQVLMEEFQKYLIFSNPLVVDADEETQPSVLDQLQASIVKVLSLYVSKDEEPFMPFLQAFSEKVWNLLMTCTAYPKHDILAVTSIKFLSMLVEKPMHKDLFKGDAILREIVLKIVIPNLMFRESDEERFEDDPREYIVTEVEGSDSESRRRCSQDLLKAMCRLFEEQTTTICSEHVGQMLSNYAKDQNAHWREKDAAIHLMMGIAIRRENSFVGVTEVSSGVSVVDFFQSQILPELEDSNHGNKPVVKATALKYVSVFRNQFSKEHLVQLFKLVISHLSSPIVVVHTFAAYTLEQILTTPETIDGKGKKIHSADLRPMLDPLFTGLFQIIDDTTRNENDNAMKCVMRSLATVGQEVGPVAQTVFEKLTSVLARVAKNPRNPQFNHSLFESIAVLVRNMCSANAAAAASIEQMLFPPFTSILSQDVVEFTPYVFQILAQLLEFRTPGSGLGASYESLFSPLLSAQLWEKQGNVPALVRLVTAYLGQDAKKIAQEHTSTPILGIFQKLVANKRTEVHAFALISACVSYFPHEAILPHLSQIFSICMTRFQQSKTPRYTRLAVAFFALLVATYGAETFVQHLSSVQQTLPLQTLQFLWLPSIVDDPPRNLLETKVHVVALTRLLCESPLLLSSTDGQSVWKLTLTAVMSLLANKSFAKHAFSDFLETQDDNSSMVYDAQYSQLSYARKAAVDPLAHVNDPKGSFIAQLNSLTSSNRDTILPLIHDALQSNPKVSESLQSMFREAGLTLG